MSTSSTTPIHEGFGSQENAWLPQAVTSTPGPHPQASEVVIVAHDTRRRVIVALVNGVTSTLEYAHDYMRNGDVIIVVEGYILGEVLTDPDTRDGYLAYAYSKPSSTFEVYLRNQTKPFLSRSEAVEYVFTNYLASQVY